MSPDVVVLAGYMRIVGPAVLAAFAGRILNTHPSLLPAFPGAHAVADALAHGAVVTGCTVHLVDETLDGGPIVAQEAVAILPDDDVPRLHERIRAVEHRLLPRSVGLLLAGAISVAPDGRRVLIDLERADARVPVPRRALLSVSDKTGLVELGRGLVARGFELVSTGGTARALRDAGLPVTDVAAVTGFPEMLDGRIKTLHPRVHGGLLADRRLAAHRQAIIAAAIAPFELVVVNLYPFAAALERPGITIDDLIEEIDIGGPSMVRAAAKNHANVAIVTDPARYAGILDALDSPNGIDAERRRALALEAFAHTAAYDARIAAELPRRMAAAGQSLPDEPGLPGAGDPYPPRLTVTLEKVETLRYGENPHQPAARYRRPGDDAGGRPVRRRAGPVAGQGALVQQRARRRGRRGARPRPARPGGRHRQAHQPVRRRRARDAARRVVRGARGRSGQRVRRRRGADAPGRSPGRRGAHVALPRGRRRARVHGRGARGPRREAEPARPHRRGPRVRRARPAVGGRPDRLDPDGRRRGPRDGAGHRERRPDAVDVRDAAGAHRRRVARPRPRLASRPGVTSNAIVLVKDRRLVGMGSGQTSRVDAARQAVAKAHAMLGEDATRGAACGSDAFFPFPDAVEACLAAGVTAFAQPGGSVRDAETVAIVDAAGAAMLMTGTRHFRH